MEITASNLTSILDSKIFVKDNKTFESPRTYIEPVVESMLRHGVQEDMITVQTEKAVINRNDDGTENISYPRIKVECRLHEQNTIGGNISGFIIALDRNQFISYTGSRVFACTNLCVFSDEEVFNVKGDYQAVQNKFTTYLDNSTELLAKFTQFHNSMEERSLTEQEYNHFIKHIIYYSRSKKGLSPSIVNQGLTNLINPQSVYHFDLDTVNNSMWNLYNAFTQVISDKNFNSLNPTYIVDAPEATKALTNAFMEFSN